MKVKKKCTVCGKEFETHDFLGRTECSEHYVKPTREVKHRTTTDITYVDGGKTKTISKSQLKEIKSGVRTHEGEFLSGKKGRKYLDKYSKSMMGKDLSGSYRV